MRVCHVWLPGVSVGRNSLAPRVRSGATQGFSARFGPWWVVMSVFEQFVPSGNTRG